ncbi:MAG: MFS transporter [Candidatus Bathyarchaeia archaeon]
MHSEVRFERPLPRWVMVPAMVYVTVISYLIRSSVPPVLPLIMEEFRITGALGGLLITAVTIPCIFLPIIGGMLADKYGMKLVGKISLLLLILGSLVMGLTPSYLLALAGRFLIGLGIAVIPVITFSIIAASFSLNEMGKAIGLRSTSTPISLALSFPIFSSVGVAYGWRACLFLAAFLGITSLMVFWTVTGKMPSQSLEGNRSGRSLNFSQVLFNIELWKLGIVWSFTSMAFDTIQVWGPTLFVKFKGLDLIQASLISMLVIAMLIPASPFFGWISDRFKRRKIIFLTGLTIATITYPLISYVKGLELAFIAVIIGIATSPIPVLTYVLTPEIVDKHLIATGYGFILSLLNIGSAAASPLIGYIYDLTSNLTTIILVPIITSITALITALTLKIK